MKNNDFKKLINKYSILLLIGYSLTFVMFLFSNRLVEIFNYNDSEFWPIIFTISTLIIQLFVNIFAAYFVSDDLKEYGIKNNLIIVMTLLFSLLGITMFFISISKKAENAST
jgi:hypothetical protein